MRSMGAKRMMKCSPIGHPEALCIAIFLSLIIGSYPSTLGWRMCAEKLWCCKTPSNSTIVPPKTGIRAHLVSGLIFFLGSAHQLKLLA